MINTEKYLKFTRVGSVSKTDRGLLAELHGEGLRIDVLASDAIRAKISRGGVFDEAPSHALTPEMASTGALPKQPVLFEFALNDNEATITTVDLRIVVGLNPFFLDVWRTDGTPVVETARDANGNPRAFETLNDAFAVYRKIGANDAVYGLGEKAGRQNRRGRSFTLWNTDVLSPDASGEFTKDYAKSDPRSDNTSSEFDPFYISIPFFYAQTDSTSAVMGSFLDNPYRGFYDFTSHSEYQVHFDGGQYTEYIFAGPTISGILSKYTELTGRADLPPMWALGYHQCRWHKYTQAEVLELGAKHRELDVPLDTLWLDIDYMDGYRVFTWNDELFPNPGAMLSELAADKLGAITIIDPGVKHDPGYAVHDDGVAKDVFARTAGGGNYIGQVWPGDTLFPDFTKPETREWWGALNAEHVRSGLAGIWNDMNEPATGNIKSGAMRFTDGKFEHDKFHNQYALLMAMGTVDGLKEVMPELRTFVLSRAGSAGIQRYAANWMGDNFSRWDHLWVSIPMGAGLGLSGQSFVGADIGGFAEDTTPELFARWIQYGALTPFARNHSVINTIDQYVWSFGSEVLDIAREALKLRYRLLPYIYSAFVKNNLTGEPIQRPLIFDYQDDPNVRDLDTEYLFGRDLLVAPVLEAGLESREVYLPAGEWFDFYSDERILAGDGTDVVGETITVELSSDSIPVFVRAGAIVPMWAEAPKSAREHYPAVLELHAYVPSADGTFSSFLQEDDGLTFGAKTDAFIRTELTLTRAGNTLTIVGATTGAGFDAFARANLRIVLHGINEDATPGGIELENSGQNFEVEVQL
jgi:alpha-glucosidase